MSTTNKFVKNLREIVLPNVDYETIEPTDADAAEHNGSVVTKGSRQSFNNLRRELTEDELSNPGTQKMLLDDLDRLEGEVEKLNGIEIDYHETSVRLAVLEERFKTYSAVELLSTGVVALGSLLTGGTFGTLQTAKAEWGLFGIGLALILVGIVA